MVTGHQSTVSSFSPFFGVRRTMRFPDLERIDFPAGDGAALVLHHTSGGTRGPVILSPGTAMTALSYCIDSVEENLVEFLVARGFDVWLFDWRTSPLLAAHKKNYTLDDVARYDWPAAVGEVRRHTGADRVTVLAHCLSSPCFVLSLVRGYLPAEQISSYVASQAALHLVMTRVGQVKLMTRLDRLLPGSEMIHELPADVNALPSDLAISFLSTVLPKSYHCDNPSCDRQSATFGEIIQHSQLNATTHAMMGELVPECLTAFLKDVAVWTRRDDILTAEDRTHLDRLRLPMLFISGSENRMFVPESTAKTYEMLRQANGDDFYHRTVFQGFGHLDCFIGETAAAEVWPDLVGHLAN
jgi:cholesterol oxidase